MNKHRRLIFALASGLILSVACVFFYQSNEPRYEGTRAEKWLGIMQNGNHLEARRAFRNMGKQVVPFLISVLERDESKSVALYRKLHMKFYSQIPDGVMHKLPDPWQHANRKSLAALALSEIGTNATEAIPFILKALNDPTVLKVKVEDAGFINGIQGNLMLAVAALAPNSPFERETVEALISHTHHLDPYPRRMAYLQLGRFSGFAERSVPVLLQGLDDKDEEVRDSTVEALGLLGPKAISTSSNLLHYIRAQPASSKAKEALKRINPEAAAEAGIE